MARLKGRRGWLAATAAVLASGLVAAGCGDDDDNGEDTAATFTGEPVKVYVQLPIETELADFGDAAEIVEFTAEQINDEGGLDGHELVVEVCNDTDASSEQDCVRQAANDNALAFIGSVFIFDPGGGQDALAKAKIPNLAPVTAQLVEFSNPINFPIYATSFGVLACPEQLVAATGAQPVGAISEELPPQEELLQTLDALSSARGFEYSGAATVPVEETDFTSAVRELSDQGAKSVVNVLTPTGTPAFFSAIEGSGSEFEAYCGDTTNFTYDNMRQLNNGDVYVSIGLPPPSEEKAEELPLIQEFRDDTEAAVDAGFEADLEDANSPDAMLNGWLSLRILEQVVPEVTGDLNSANLLKALNQAQVDLSEAGVPPLDFSKPAEVPGFERLFNPILELYRWDPEAGDLVEAEAEPVNALDLFTSLG